MARKARGFRGGFLGRHAAGLCAIGAALAVEFLWAVEWWRPGCANSDGRSAYATGFPIPFAQASTASSMDFRVMPHVLLLDLAMVAAVLFPLFMVICRWLPGRVRTVVGALGLTATVPGLLAWVFFLLVADRFVWSIADPALDGSLTRYRPAAIALPLGKQPCD